jgi:hypothetical protein
MGTELGEAKCYFREKSLGNQKLAGLIKNPRQDEQKA